MGALGGRQGGRGDPFALLRASSTFAPPDPPHSVLALLTMPGGECAGRWVAPGTCVPGGRRQGGKRPMDGATERGWAGGKLLPNRRMR